MIRHWWLYGRKWSSLPLPKGILGPPYTEAPKKIWNLPLYREFSSPTWKKNHPPPLRPHITQGWGRGECKLCICRSCFSIMLQVSSLENAMKNSYILESLWNKYQKSTRNKELEKYIDMEPTKQETLNRYLITSDNNLSILYKRGWQEILII